MAEQVKAKKKVDDRFQELDNLLEMRFREMYAHMAEMREENRKEYRILAADIGQLVDKVISLRDEIKKDKKCKNHVHSVEEALKKIEPKLEQLVSEQVKKWLGYESDEWINKMYR